jgi:hypothetical protein
MFCQMMINICLIWRLKSKESSNQPHKGKVITHLYRFVEEIIADLPELYELSPEAVQWVEKQIRYNGYGGKMNRGLSILSVHREFVKAKNAPLTNKVRNHLRLFCCILYITCHL